MSIIYLGKATPASGQGGGGSGEAVWGDITGTLSDQTDLQTALNAKQDELTAGTGIDITDNTISVDGELTSTVTLATVATSGDYADLTNKLLPFTGATGTMDGTSGLVPTPIATDFDKYLKGDGTWSSISSSGLQNTATGSGSLTILGTPASVVGATNIGETSGATGNYSIALGHFSSGTGDYSIAIGYYAEASFGSQYCYQIGYGANYDAYNLCVGFGYDNGNALNYKLLDGRTGLIPTDRLTTFTGADGTNAGTKGAVPAPTATDNDKFLKGDGTWGTPSGGSVTVDQVYSASSANAQSGVAISGAGFLRDNGYPAVNTMAIGGTVQDSNNGGGLAVGYLSKLTGQFNGVALGSQAQANSNAIAIGNQTIASSLWSIAIGRAAESSADYAIALGTGCVNSEANSMYVAIGDVDASYNIVSYKLLGTGGKIPNDRIDGVSGSFTTNDGKTITITNGVVTSIV